jgi:hypothetical protein
MTNHFEPQVESFIGKYIRNRHRTGENCFAIDKTDIIENIRQPNYYNFMICLPLLNDFKNINQALIKINNSLKPRGIFVGRVETLGKRKRCIASFYNRFFYKIIIIYEFIFKRVLPKVFGIRHIYKKFRIIKHHIMSKCEALGRLQYCGFEIIDIKETDEFLYFITCKSSQPSKEKSRDGILIKIPKVGKNGKPIYCYKLRTMHAYADYLHDYILSNYQLDKEGKVIGDFRKTNWGGFLRKTWLDEIPQLYNILKGDLSFIGFRPLSREFLKKYPESWRRERMKIKPGFVPPYYADCPKSFAEIIESEKRYYKLKMKHPITTDIVYFLKVLTNFVLRRTRTG